MKGWRTEESLGANLIHLWMTAHVMCLSATIMEALTRGVGPCEVSISAFVPNYVIWKGQRHIKAELRSPQPLLQLHRRLLMHSDATTGKEDWMWIIISTKGSCAVCACVLNAYKWEPFSSSQKPPPLMYYTEQRPEWSRVGWKRSDGIMHFCSPHWRCIEFYFSQWLDKITFKSLSFYCDWFFHFFQRSVRSFPQTEAVKAFFRFMTQDLWLDLWLRIYFLFFFFYLFLYSQEHPRHSKRKETQKDFSEFRSSSPVCVTST